MVFAGIVSIVVNWGLCPSDIPQRNGWIVPIFSVERKNMWTISNHFILQRERLRHFCVDVGGQSDQQPVHGTAVNVALCKADTQGGLQFMTETSLSLQGTRAP